jgi:protocatechuate 3,4-dioxygenase beta subunit
VGELLSAKGTTDLKGHYSLGPVFSGLSYGVNTRLSGYSSPGYTIIEAVKGESLSIPSIKLAKMDGIISGLVMDEDGKPMANVKVASGFGADENAVYSDSKGRFTLKHFPRGKSRVWAQKEGYSEEGNDDIQSGDTDVEITMVKNQPQSAPPAGDAVVSGRVVDNDGKPVGGAVILLREVNKATNAQYYLQLSNTDDNGKFEKDNVPADFDYTVASIFNINGYYIDAPDNIKAHKAGENASTDIIVYKLDSSISGKVIDSVGKPASGVSIYVEGSIDNRANLTGKDGSFNVHAPAGKKVTLLTREASGECAQTQTIGGSKDVLIQLLMPKHHGDGTPAKKLLITTLAQAKIVHKGVLINFYQSMEPSTTTSCLFDKDLRQILSKYFVILDIDTWESHDAWINSGWQQLRDPLTHKRIDSSWLFSASGKLLSAEIPHSYNPATNNVDAKAILETLKNAAPQITDSDAKIIADRINEMIEAAKKKI